MARITAPRRYRMYRTKMHQARARNIGVELNASRSRLTKSLTLRRRFYPSLGFRALATFAALCWTIATAWAQDKPLPLPDKYEQPLGTCYEELRYPYPTAYLNLFAEGQDLRMCFMDIQPLKIRMVARSCCCTGKISTVRTGPIRPNF